MEAVRGKRRKFTGATLNGTGVQHDGKRALYHCNYCQKDISSCPRIKCAVCPDFDLCLECFAVGCEITPHKSDHDYRVVDNLSFPIYHPAWGVDEEILLLEAIDIYGPGNWGAVAEHVGGKSAAACKAHYHEVYIHVNTYPLPKPLPAMQYYDSSVLPLQQQQQQRKVVEDTLAAGATAANLHKQENSWAELNRQEEAQLATSMPDVSMQRPCKKGRTSLLQGPTAAQDQGLGFQSTQIKEEVKEERSCPASIHEMKVEQSEKEAEEKGGTLLSGAAHVTMDVDSGHLEGEHLTQGQKAAAKGMKHVAHAHATSKNEPEAENEVHQTAATGRKLQGADHAQPTVPPVSTYADGLLGPPEKAAQAQQGAGSVAGAMEGPSGRAAPTSKAAAAAAEHDPKIAGYDVTGYHAKRKEFDPEYDNDAEAVIADMEFTDADTEDDKQLKLRMLEIYNKRLDEREARHDFLAEHGLLNMRKVQALDRRRTSSERDTHARLRVFARYSAPAEHDDLVEGLLLEQRLRSRIEELKEHRRLGARTIADAEAMESDRKLRARIQTQPQPPSNSHPHRYSYALLASLGNTPMPGATPFPVVQSPYLPAATPQLSFQDGCSLDSFAAGANNTPLPLLSPLPASAAGTAAGAAPGRSLAGSLASGDPPCALGAMQSLESQAAQTLNLPPGGVGLQGSARATPPGDGGPHTQQHLNILGGQARVGGWGLRGLGPPPSATAPPPGGNKGAASALANWRMRRGVALDITCMPGVELLGAKERELCATSRLHPAHYLALKDMMLRDCARHGTISRQEARTFFRLDASRSLRLYDLWLSMGWVTAPPAPKKGAGGAAGETAASGAGVGAHRAMDDGDTEFIQPA